MGKDKSTKPTHNDPTATNDIDTLCSLLGSKDGVTRSKARAALVDIGRPAVKALVGALKDRNQTVRWESAKALGQISDPKSIDALIAALQDRLFDVRWLAAEALIGIGDKAVGPILQTIVDNPDSEEVREGAHHVLHDLRASRYLDILKPVIASMEDVTFTLDIPLEAKKAIKAIR
ncbi:MAG: HEAT repeat domain-containing protein [Dehalococcoidia bacterium]|nr:HEAT repeat domain-containing protein [Dehalococcoidia bacterium]